MLSYILRRILQMLPTLLGVILLIFFLFKFFGGDPVEIMAGMKASPERLASLRAQLGLDKSVMEQLWVFVQQVFTFNWGRSWTTNEAISDIFATRLPATLTIMIPILILEVLLAIGAGLAVAYVRGSLTDRAIMILTTVALSISFLVYIIVGQYLFGFILGWFPVQGWSNSVWTNLVTYAPLPVFLAVLVSLAPQTRLYRSFFLDEIGQDYVRTARAKGVTENGILFKHVLRNAMIPILTNVATGLPGVFHRLVPDRSLLLHPRAGARDSGGGEPQRLPRHSGGHGVSRSTDHGDQPDHRCAVQVC
jgi:peptide/nickel transport system permease protein